MLRVILSVCLVSVFGFPAIAVTNQEVGEIEEILVTAHRREQSAQDAALSLQVLSGADLDRQGKDGFEDYLLDIPGVSFRDQGSGAKKFALRGVSNHSGGDTGGGTVSTAGLYLNDVAIQGSSVMPDLNLYDLNRIEVLKGPQGTLYGEGVMGGAVRMILNQPDLDEFGYKGDVTAETTKDGDMTYRIRGAVNIPLVEGQSALRLVGSYKDQGGYIDNLTTGVSDANTIETYNVRAMLSAHLSDNVSVELLAMYDESEFDDFSQIDSTIGDLENSLPEDRNNNSEVSLYAATLKWDLGFAALTSSTSYMEFEREFNLRFPSLEGFFGLFGIPISQQPEFFTVDQSSTAQEFRLVSNGDGRVDWILGGYYRDRDSDLFATIYLAQNDFETVNAVFSAFGLGEYAHPEIIVSYIDEAYEQYAIYGEVNIQLSDQWEATLGARWFDEDVEFSSRSVGLAPILDVLTNSNTGGLNESDTILRAGLSYRPSDDVLIYLEAAEGFRSGGVNFQFNLTESDQFFGSDELWNYEIGVKSTLNNGRVTLNASLFYIDWTDIQGSFQAPSLITPGATIGIVNNGGDGEIRGLEFELAAQVSDNLMVGFAGAYQDSEMTDAEFDSIEGEDLPNAPEFSFTAYAEYAWSFRSGEAYFRVDHQQTDDQLIRLVSTSSNGLPVDGYHVTNLRLGYDQPAWGAEFYIENVTDERGELGRGFITSTADVDSFIFTVNRPRTIGLHFWKNI